MLRMRQTVRPDSLNLLPPTRRIGHDRFDGAQVLYSPERIA